jgi:hypothetical protein
MHLEGRTPTFRLLALALVAALALLAPGPAAAGLADIIPGLFAVDIFLAPPTGPFPSHETHFLDEGRALAATGSRINESLVTQLSTFPVVSSAGGFAYTFDPTLGTFSRASDSFGPFYTERALTVGRGRWSLGLSHQQARYDTLDDIPLRSGALEFQLLHQDEEGTGRLDPFFEGDLINVNTAIDLKSRTTVLFANYGISDRFDLGVAVPFVDVDLWAQATLTIDRLATQGLPGLHRFHDGSDQMVFTDSGSASGVGDVLLRGKYRFFERGATGMALGLDLRLPTGDEDDLLGTGVTQGKLFLIGSGQWGRVSPHVNLGYATASGSSRVVGDLPDELTYNLALDLAAHPRATLAFELIGRTLLDATQARSGLETFQFRRQDGSIQFADRNVVRLEENDLSLLLGSVGVKFNPAANLLVTAGALWSLSSDGLVDDDVIFVVGLDYSF